MPINSPDPSPPLMPINRPDLIDLAKNHSGQIILPPHHGIIVVVVDITTKELAWVTTLPANIAMNLLQEVIRSRAS